MLLGKRYANLSTAALQKLLIKACHLLAEVMCDIRGVQRLEFRNANCKPPKLEYINNDFV